MIVFEILEERGGAQTFIEAQRYFLLDCSHSLEQDCLQLCILHVIIADNVVVGIGMIADRIKGEGGTASCWTSVNEGVLVASDDCIVFSDGALKLGGFSRSWFVLL